MADIVRYAGQGFIDCSRRWINGQHEKVLSAIMRCRTASRGGHRDQCSSCRHSAVSYNSCRNRHCPKCQGNARIRWLQQRERELLPTRYVHAVFTLPHELAPLALQNKRLIYGLLFRASAATLLGWLATHNISELRSASSASSIPGTRGCSTIPCPLCHRCRWPRAGSLRLDPIATILLPAGQGARTCLPRQVRHCSEDRVP
jgi:hypothetical protein